MNEQWKKLSEEIPVPESLEPDRIEQTLKRRQTEHPSSYTPGRMKRGIALAACLTVLILAGASLCLSRILPSDNGESPSGDVRVVMEDESETDSSANSGDGSEQNNPANGDDGTPAAGTASSEPAEQMPHTTYHKLRKTISEYNKTLEKQNGYSDDAIALAENADTFAGSGAAPDTRATKDTVKSAENDANTGNYTKTDLQVQGVDEGDIVKTDGTSIFTCRDTIYGSKIRIYRADGAATKRISEIKTDDITVHELYLDQNRLIAVGTRWDENNSDNLTCILIYDISNTAKPTLCAKKTQSGWYHTSRKNGTYLYTLSKKGTDYRLDGNDDKDPKHYVPCMDGTAFPEDRLYLPEHVSSNSYLVITALDVTDGTTFTDSLSVLGSGGICYVSENHIFVGSAYYKNGTKTKLSKFEYENGKLSAQSSRTFNGVLNDQFSMDEYDGTFRFVATTYGPDGSTTNGLYVLDKNLKPLGSVDKLAKNERIYSARFLGTKAYFVTYRETDPVFLVDLSNPKKPVVKDKLKIPGFSEYLHPYGDSLLLGIGSQQSKKGDMQVKLSMFDSSSDQAVRELDHLLIQKGEESSSIAGRNHKAVLVDTERNRIGLCISSWNLDDTTKVSEDTVSYNVYSYDSSGFHKITSLAPPGLTLQGARGLFIGKHFYLIDEDTKKGIYVYDDTFKPVR